MFYQTRLYALMGLQVFYVAISIYGWYHWLFGGANRTRLKVSLTPRWLWPVMLVIWLAGSWGLGTFLSRNTDAVLPHVDSALTVGSLLAQWMMTRKYLENWAVWVLLDVAYVLLYINRQLYPTAILYAVFLALATRGLFEWRQSWRADRLAAGDPASRPA